MKEIIENLKNQHPELKNPKKLTADIMLAIDHSDTIQIGPKNYFASKNMLRFQRILAAASIILILVFGMEQYIILNKIQKLEKQVSMISSTRAHPSKLKMMLKISSGLRFEATSTGNFNNAFKNNSLLLKARVALSQLNIYELSRIDKNKLIQQLDPDVFRTLKYNKFSKLDSLRFIKLT